MCESERFLPLSQVGRLVYVRRFPIESAHRLEWEASKSSLPARSTNTTSAGISIWVESEKP